MKIPKKTSILNRLLKLMTYSRHSKMYFALKFVAECIYSWAVATLLSQLTNFNAYPYKLNFQLLSSEQETKVLPY